MTDGSDCLCKFASSTYVVAASKTVTTAAKRLYYCDADVCQSSRKSEIGSCTSTSSAVVPASFSAPLLISLSQANRFVAYGAHFGAQKMTVSRFALKKRPVKTAEMPVLN